METKPRALPSALATALAFGASGAVLVLEIVALRLVGPYVGVTLQVSSSVIGVALAAIAYGAWIGGRLADKFDPRTLLAPALILGAIGTAITLPLVRWGGELLRGGAAPAVLLLAALAIFLPALVLSTVAPMVVKLQLGDLREAGSVVGRLSSVGTLGAITATLVTGFVFVAAMPSSAIILSLAVLLAVSGALLAWWLRRDGTRPDLPGTPKIRASLAAVGLVGAGLGAAAPTPCDVETAYHCASIVEDPARDGGRTLVLNSARHSYVDLTDPTYLEFEYVQWIAAAAGVLKPAVPAAVGSAAPGALDPATAPIDALHLGGGGFTVPNLLRAVRPGSRQLVLELDGGLVDLDERGLGLKTGPDLTVQVGDARVGLAERPDASYDLVVGDAFGHLVVPWHLATREMAEDVARVLRPGGVYAQNVIDYPPNRFIRAEVATVAAAFPHVALISTPAALDGEKGSNFVILASREPLPVDAISPLLAALKEPASLLSGAALTDFVGDSHVLTDDYAPVDQLLAG
ncbi:fused MFS/spermidine synthase [Actinoplanes sp. NEAU-A12]|uniref:Fused MFS/spermidine synthase n=1 Tax=Actinoplanes sandaracinus TaxID=3045177 RepID=A0ABT6WFZ8_9ACTN|nr:fused MFS/spermidine synthase [Actinoplanes sandaracinus]MDI6098646.1 fused MFS/spermidine synthase [Actinoplanes sandaracinus]